MGSNSSTRTTTTTTTKLSPMKRVPKLRLALERYLCRSGWEYEIHRCQLLGRMLLRTSADVLRLPTLNILLEGVNGIRTAVLSLVISSYRSPSPFRHHTKVQSLALKLSAQSDSLCIFQTLHSEICLILSSRHSTPTLAMVLMPPRGWATPKPSGLV